MKLQFVFTNSHSYISNGLQSDFARILVLIPTSNSERKQLSLESLNDLSEG